MTTPSVSRPSSPRKALIWLLIPLAAMTLALSNPAKADYYGYRHERDRQHANPYRGYDSDHDRWRHHHHRRHYEERCTTRAIPYWDGFWGQWRNRYVRECW
jgi:hypothetical protein